MSIRASALFRSGSLTISCVVTTESVEGPRGDPGEPGASPFTLVGEDAVYTGGKVGIGTETPTEALSVKGNISVTGAIYGTHHLTQTPWHIIHPESPKPPGQMLGYWKLVTPVQAHEQNRFSIEIRMLRHATGGDPASIRCDGYASVDAPDGLQNPSCRVEGMADPVRIGVEDGHIVIFIGSLIQEGPRDDFDWYADYATFDYIGALQSRRTGGVRRRLVGCAPDRKLGPDRRGSGSVRGAGQPLRRCHGAAHRALGDPTQIA